MERGSVGRGSMGVWGVESKSEERDGEDRVF